MWAPFAWSGHLFRRDVRGCQFNHRSTASRQRRMGDFWHDAVLDGDRCDLRLWSLAGGPPLPIKPGSGQTGDSSAGALLANFSLISANPSESKFSFRSRVSPGRNSNQKKMDATRLRVGGAAVDSSSRSSCSPVRRSLAKAISRLKDAGEKLRRGNTQ